MRRPNMRRVCELALLLTVMAVPALGCTDGGPEPEQWELVEAEPSVEAHAGFEHQPERPRLVDPATQPRLELVAREFDPEDGLCPYDVEPRAFPAIDESGTVVEVTGFSPPNADFPDEVELRVLWLDADATHVDSIVQRLDDHPEEEGACEQAISRARERVAAVNAKLASRTWRALEQLDAYYSAPGFGLQQAQTGYEDEVLASLPGAERPVEIYYRNGHFIARIRGVRVLQDDLQPQWRQRDNEFCLSDAQIQSLELDRPSKLALVRYNYSSGGCLCDDREYVARLELSDELLAAAEQRSTAKFVAAAHERMAADQG